MDVVCEVCGVVGFKHLLVQCNNCKDSTRHRYCMDTIVFDGPLEFSCNDCLPKNNELMELVNVFYNQKQQDHIQLDPSIPLRSDVNRVEVTKVWQPWGQRRYRSGKRYGPLEFSCDDCLPKNNELMESVNVFYNQKQRDHIHLDPSITIRSDVNRVEVTKVWQPWGQRRYRSRKRYTSKHFLNGGTLNSSEILFGKLSKHNNVEKEAEGMNRRLLNSFKCVHGPNHPAYISTSEIKEDTNVEKAVACFEPTMNSMEVLVLADEKELSFPPKQVEELFPQGTKADTFHSINDFGRCHLRISDNSGPILSSVEQADASSHTVECVEQPQPLEVVKLDGSDHSALDPALQSKENIVLENAMGSFEPTLNSIEWLDLSRQRGSCGFSSMYVAGSIHQGSSNDDEGFHPSVNDGFSPEMPSEENVDGSGPLLESWQQPEPLVVLPPFDDSIQGLKFPSNSQPVQQSDQNIENGHLNPSKVFMDMRPLSKATEQPCSSNGQGASTVEKDDLDRTKYVLDKEFIAPMFDDHKRSSLSAAEGCLVSNSVEVNISDNHLLGTTHNREKGQYMLSSRQKISRGEFHCGDWNDRCNSWSIQESSDPKSALMGNQQVSSLQDGVRKISVCADNMSNGKDAQYVNDAKPGCSNAAQTFGNGMLKKRKGLGLRYNKEKDEEALQVEDLNQSFEDDGQLKKHRIHVENGVTNQSVYLENYAEALLPGTSKNQVVKKYMQTKKQKSIKGNGDENAVLGDANSGCALNSTAQLASQHVVAWDSSVTSMSVISTPTISTRPIDKPYWTGIMKIDQDYVSLAAHLSNKASKEVQELSRSLPPVMKVMKYPKAKAYPSRLEESELNAESIRLYFFSHNMRPNKDLDRLVQNVTDHSIVLKYVVDFAKLLIFSSVLLPEQSQLFQGKHYLWGVFKRRKARSNTDPPVKRQDHTFQVVRKSKAQQDSVQIDTLVQEKHVSTRSNPNGSQTSPSTVNDVDNQARSGDGGQAWVSSEAPAPTVFGVFDVRTPKQEQHIRDLINEGAVVFQGNGLANGKAIGLLHPVGSALTVVDVRDRVR